MPTDASQRLIWHGLFLVLLGLLTGAAIPLATNARMGLSAHLAGVQNGILLAVLGLVWGRVALPARAGAAASWLALYAMYAIWAATLLGAFFGTSRATPIAGEGYVGAAWQEALVDAGLVTGSAAVLVAVVLVVYGLGLRRPAP